MGGKRSVIEIARSVARVYRPMSSAASRREMAKPASSKCRELTETETGTNVLLMSRTYPSIVMYVL